MKAGEPFKFITGLNQKPDPELGGWQTLSNIDLSEPGIAKATKINKSYLQYDADIVSIGMAGIDQNKILFSNTETALFLYANQLRTLSYEQKLSYASHSGRVYALGNTDGLLYYNGTTSSFTYNAGAPAPAGQDSSGGTVFAAAAGAAGDFNGDYELVVTWGNENGYDGNPNATPITVSSLTADKINLTNIPINSTDANTDTSYNITKRKIWIKGGTNPIYNEYVLALTISDNTTTSYTGLDVSDVDELTLLEDDNDVAQLGKVLANHYDTFFMAGVDGFPNTLFYSKSGRVEQWPLAQAIKVSQPGDPIETIESRYGALWVFTRAKVFQIIGSPGSGILTSNFYVKETQSTKGAKSYRSPKRVPTGAYFEAEDGIFNFNGDISENVGFSVQDFINARTGTMVGVGAYWDDQYVITLATENSLTNNVTLLYDFETKTWTSHDQGYTDMAVDEVNNRLYVATGNKIEMFREGETYAAWEIRTKDISAGLDTYAAFGKYQIEMEGSCSVNVYLDDTLFSTRSLSATTRQVFTGRIAGQIARRLALELVGSASSTQSKVYSISYSLEPTRGQI